MKNIYDNDPEISDQRWTLMEQLEAAKSECDWRSIGGYKNQDERFAYEMRDAISNVLAFLDRIEVCMEERFSSIQRDMDEQAFENRQISDKLDRIKEWTIQVKNLNNVSDIIDE